MTDRSANLQTFLQQEGCDLTSVTLFAGDASNRKYFRLTRSGQRVVLMDADPSLGEDVMPFVSIARHLRDAGLSAPEIYAEDTAHGFLLIEDLGDDLFARLFERGAADEETLYASAVDVLLHLAHTPPPALAPYSAAGMAELSSLSVTWYQTGATGQEDRGAFAQMQKRLAALFSDLDDGPQVLIQRDYHAENLLWLPDRTGIARVGLLDFQDAMLGHPAYDLVSVLQDARRDVPPALEQSMIERYLHASGLDRATFLSAYHRLGLQRNLRILGVFARLSLRDAKPGYIDFIPRVWEFIERNLAALEDASLSRFVFDTLPRPNAAVLDRLRAGNA